MTDMSFSALHFNIYPHPHMSLRSRGKSVVHSISLGACHIRGCTLWHGEQANKVKRTVIFHFIETSASTLPLFLPLSLHVSLILSLQAAQIARSTTSSHSPACLLFLSLRLSDSSSLSLTVNSPECALQLLLRSVHWIDFSPPRLFFLWLWFVSVFSPHFLLLRSFFVLVSMIPILLFSNLILGCIFRSAVALRATTTTSIDKYRII